MSTDTNPTGESAAASKRNPWIAGLMGFFVTGLGQMYNGQFLRGVLIVLGLVGLFVLGVSSLPLGRWCLIPFLSGIALKFWSIIDAAQTASRNPILPIRFYNRWYYYLAVCILQLSAASVIRHELIEAFKIPSEAMVPTLEIGDHFLVDKLAYRWTQPVAGDVITFTLPDDPDTGFDESDTILIKRIVAVAGDTVELSGAVLQRNGKIIDEPYTQYLGGGVRGFGPETVPAGKVFLLGDNRDRSKDSRDWNEPFLDVSRIQGRARYIYWNSYFYWSRVGKEIQ